jgi:hypothetical protein
VYYIEFVERNAGVPQQRFQEVLRLSNERWQREHPEDESVLMTGRTGPQPGYLVVWRIEDFAIFQRWTEEFGTADTLKKHGEMEEVGTIVDAGVYENLGDEVN